jgi:hypothetical protein
VPIQDPLLKYETQLSGFRANFLGIGDTGGGFGFGSGDPQPGPIQTGNNGGITVPGVPGTSITIGGSNSGVHVGTGSVPSSGSDGSATGAVLSWLGIKRLAIFLIGLICIIGAIYLFKSTSFIVKNAIGAAKDVAKGAAAGAVAA